MFFRLALAALALLAGAQASARGLDLCGRTGSITAVEQDRILRFAGAIKQELENSGQRVALVSRSGVDLARFGLVYSHAGIALKENPAGPWSVRQLYYACEESRPRLFDQGMSGFALGGDQPALGHVSLVFLPEGEAAALEAAAMDKPLALKLLASDYSANAYAFSTRYQNCNQWLAELIATAWGRLEGLDGARERAQAWLQSNGYATEAVQVKSHWLMFAAQFVPLLHVRDHPVEDIQARALHVSLPATIESFVREKAPQAKRVELCHAGERIVIHRGWTAMGAYCQAAPGDEVISP